MPVDDFEDDITCETVLTVTTEQAGLRLDQFLAAQLPDFSRSEAKRLIELPEANTDGIRVNHRRERPSYKVRAGDRVTLTRPAPQRTHIAPEAIPLDVVFEDADVLVINKPSGMVVHPAPGAEHGTVVHAALAHAEDLSGIGGELRPGIVHRLDKDTSGLLMIAKNDLAHRHLQEQIQTRTAERRYRALVWGVPNFQHATIDAPIGRHPADRKKMAVLTDARHAARPARTELFVQSAFAGTCALIEAKLHTGRTHQIRVHCAYIQHPVLGDVVYGGLRKLPVRAFLPAYQSQIERAIRALDGQALHAFSLAFDHPRTGERLVFTSPFPDPMQNLLALLQAACA